MQEKGAVVRAVLAAHRRLARIAGRSFLRVRAASILCLATVAGVVETLAFSPDRSWLGAAATVACMGAVAGVAAKAFCWLGRRRGPSEVAAARAIDGALGLAEVAASAFAFERDGRKGPLVDLTRERAESAVSALDPGEAFPVPSLRPTGRAIVAAAGALGLVVLAGFLHPAAWMRRTQSSSGETRAASRLEATARAVAQRSRNGEEVEHPKSRPPNPRPAGRPTKIASLSALARAASLAARRGDRPGALSLLDDLRRAGQEAESREDALTEALRRVAEALADARPSPAPAATASEALADLGRQIAGASSPAERAAVRASIDRLAERLRDLASTGGPGAATAEAIARAAAALARGDSTRAGQSLAQAAGEAQALETQAGAASEEANAMAQLLDAAAALERDLLGAPAEDGTPGRSFARAPGGGQAGGEAPDGEGAGDGSAGSDRSLRVTRGPRAKNGSPDGTGAGGPGPGGGAASHEGGRIGARAVPGAVRARSPGGGGGQALGTLRGLGSRASTSTGTGARAFLGDEFSAYEVGAEDGMNAEAIPAARRAVVRRYFRTIRPGGSGAD